MVVPVLPGGENSEGGVGGTLYFRLPEILHLNPKFIFIVKTMFVMLLGI